VNQDRRTLAKELEGLSLQPEVQKRGRRSKEERDPGRGVEKEGRAPYRNSIKALVEWTGWGNGHHCSFVEG